MKRARLLLPLLFPLVLAACGAVPQRMDAQPQPSMSRNPADDRRVHTDLVRQMLAQGQYYAALAHIQQQKAQAGANPELTYLEAECQRKLGRNAPAEKLYRSLLQGGWAGPAYHGLGLLYADRQLPVALGYLRRAATLRPTDANLRNDLGYALMLARRYPEARAELSTAVELDPADVTHRNNLIVLLLVQGDEAGARTMARDAELSDEALAGLRRQAQSFRVNAGAQRG